MAQLILLVIYISCIWLANARSVSRVLLFSPLSIVLFVAYFKGGLGTLLVRLFGKLGLPDIDQNQYIVTFNQVANLEFLWALFGLGAVTWCALSVTKRKIIIAKGSVAGWVSERRLTQTGEKRNPEVKGIYVALGLFTLSYAIIGLTSGVIDRGSEYATYATSEKGVTWDIIIAFLRLRDIFFVMTPLMVSRYRSWTIPFCSFIIAITIVVGVLSGGRGDILYPIAMLLVGFYIATGDLKKIAIGVTSAVIIFMVLTPVLQSLREDPAFLESSLTNPVNRVNAIINATEGIQGKFIERAPLIGRQVYACSDPFLFETSNSGFLDYGFNDIGKILRSVLPAGVAGADVQTFDGAALGQRIIGVNIKGWFPCISLPADLYRRGGWSVVLFGGLVFWFLIKTLDMLWEKVITKSDFSIYGLLLFFLPVTYLRSSPLSTVREVAWTLGWDLVKYIGLFAVLSALVKACFKRNGEIDEARKDGSSL